MKKTIVARLGMGIYGMHMAMKLGIDTTETANTVNELAKELGIDLMPSPKETYDYEELGIASAMWCSAIAQKLGEPDTPIWALKIFAISSGLSKFAAETVNIPSVSFRKPYEGGPIAEEIIEQAVCLCISAKIPLNRINELIMIKNVFKNAHLNLHAITAATCLLDWCKNTFADMLPEDYPNGRE
ncbi:MAG: hypothetical protein WCJ81_09395 [bacterium]